MRNVSLKQNWDYASLEWGSMPVCLWPYIKCERCVASLFWVFCIFWCSVVWSWLHWESLYSPHHVQSLTAISARPKHTLLEHFDTCERASESAFMIFCKICSSAANTLGSAVDPEAVTAIMFKDLFVESVRSYSCGECSIPETDWFNMFNLTGL